MQPIKKIKMVLDKEEMEDPLACALTVPEMIEAAAGQEIESKYLPILETLILCMQTKECVKLWMYGPKRISQHILAVVAGESALNVEVFRRRLQYDPNSLYVFDLNETGQVAVRSMLYKILENTNPVAIRGCKFAFLIPTLTDIAKLDKRIISRMDGVKVYVQEFAEEDYLKVFSRVIERMKGRYLEEKENRGRINKPRRIGEVINVIQDVVDFSGNASVVCDLPPLVVEEESGFEFDFATIDRELVDMIRQAYLVDNTFDGMVIKFYKLIYRVEDPQPYSILNPIHLVIALTSTAKRTTLSCVYEEFVRRTAGIPYFRQASQDIVHRRMIDLLDLGIVSRGYFQQNTADLESAVHSRSEVYLKVMLERVKRHWKDIPG
ncbi:hypothetical protein NEHOM01_0568 [Nematocida homosporus]|uniref:uncharacterized protein n=1 Tax=Nematocida homosporus TaxID=1912981 RepID=UPI00221EC27A|nr:uncharacterized protein NEHOM01_0568 [Nematocida homosporus]KAI5185063.1 hypothetical protein NEHOM01_0568 [Nematocida homosporus]